MCQSTRASTRGRAPIRFGTYNICNGRNGGLELALRGMSHANMDLGIFQDTKITNVVYTRGSSGYIVVTTDAPIRHHGRIEVYYRPSPRFTVEAFHQIRPNVVGFQLVKEERQWYIVGCYLAPNGTLIIESIVTALTERPRGIKLLVVGYLNLKLPEGDWMWKEIAEALTTEGLEDMLSHFRPHRHSWCQDRRKWSMVRAGREVRFLTDYTQGTDGRIFWNVSVQDPRHNSDHYLVLVCLRRSPLRKHYEDLRRLKRPPPP